jgi:hypothetical protein
MTPAAGSESGHAERRCRRRGFEIKAQVGTRIRLVPILKVIAPTADA